MQEQNNFKLLGEEEDTQFPQPPPETELGVMGNVRVFNLMSNVLELYLPKVFEMFISMVGGGTPEATSNKDPNGSNDSSSESPNGNQK